MTKNRVYALVSTLDDSPVESCVKFRALNHVEKCCRFARIVSAQTIATSRGNLYATKEIPLAIFSRIGSTIDEDEAGICTVELDYRGAKTLVCALIVSSIDRIPLTLDS